MVKNNYNQGANNLSLTRNMMQHETAKYVESYANHKPAAEKTRPS